MKRANTNNKETLDKYFEHLLNTNSPVPYITGVEKQTGVSSATISRYARKSGFYNYSDLRVNYQRTIDTHGGEDKNVIRFCEFLDTNPKIVIVTSLSTRPVGEFLLDRMKVMKIDAIIAKDIAYINEDRAALIITVSGESLRTSQFLKSTKQKFPKLIVTCVKSSGENVISLAHFMYRERTNISLFKSIRLINEWLQEALDVQSRRTNA